jgi:hypothetical protein
MGSIVMDSLESALVLFSGGRIPRGLRDGGPPWPASRQSKPHGFEHAVKRTGAFVGPGVACAAVAIAFGAVHARRRALSTCAAMPLWWRQLGLSTAGGPMSSPDLVARLRTVSTATITTVLLKKGIRRIWMQGPKPLKNGLERIAGPAFTLRFVPAREDLATPESWASPRSTRAAIEDMPEGAIAVADALGITSAGIFGDILVARMV